MNINDIEQHIIKTNMDYMTGKALVALVLNQPDEAYALLGRRTGPPKVEVRVQPKPKPKPEPTRTELPALVPAKVAPKMSPKAQVMHTLVRDGAQTFGEVCENMDADFTQVRIVLNLLVKNGYATCTGGRYFATASAFKVVEAAEAAEAEVPVGLKSSFLDRMYAAHGKRGRKPMYQKGLRNHQHVGGVLLALLDSPNPQTRAQCMSHVPTGSLGQVVGLLREHALVTESRRPGTQRTLLYTLTDSGRKLAKELK